MEQSGIYRKIKRRLIISLARRLPPCSVMVPLISEARERPLNRREEITLKLHLLTCEPCRRYAAQIERMSRTIKSNGEEAASAPESPDKLSAAARERIRAALEAVAHDKN